MGKSSSSQPTAPDPTATANTQAGYNTSAAESQANLNRINQVTPQGSISYSQTGTNSDGTPQYTQTESLSPTAQGQYNQASQVAGALGDTSSTNLANNGQIQGSLDYSSLGALPTSADFASENQQAQQANYAQAASRLDPQWANNDSDLASQLAAQGISNNSAAYTRAQNTESMAKNDAYNQAQLSSIAAGNQEASTLQQQALADYQQGATNINNQGAFANTAQSQSQGQASSVAQLLAQLSNPSFQSVSQVGVAAPDYSGLTETNYTQQNQAYEAQQQAQAQMLGQIFGSAGSVASLAVLSDKRFKENIKRVGALANGLATYTYNYVGRRAQEFGVMAQEALFVVPEAVVQDSYGTMYVNYGKVW